MMILIMLFELFNEVLGSIEVIYMLYFFFSMKFIPMGPS